jgi:diguanylate cyclase (GGDEF)-like protein
MCKHKEVIRIVLDNEKNIKYTNLDDQKVRAYLQKLKILEKLSDVLPVQYNLREYFVTIDEVNIADNKYYLITAVAEYNKCEDCSKVVIDKVTGLYNRNYWEQIINGETLNSATKNYTLIIIDVDNLKEINDIYGHTVGDKVIEIVGQGIKNCIRKDDVGLRYGGDEFTILLFNQDKKAAYKVIERISSEISKLAAKHCLSIEISAGVAHHTSLKNIKDLFNMADKDLYIEKKAKNQKEIANNNLRKEIENIRNELNRIVVSKNQKIINEEVLEISKKLDELIIKYLKNNNI